ncbi:glycosyltransferase [Desulfosporosinus sp. FKB]|uniref:glycosyltransferase n=1 Tax=Desulfosporosinus sp. FKB TaxID=1969835 RepID=UPI00148277D9|nr:glycosyltransferase [Desulfosporosinus sp. FKB]
MKRIVFFVPCEDMQASSRYRVYHFLPYLGDEFDFQVLPLMSNEDYVYFKSAGKMKLALKLPFMYLKRISEINRIDKDALVFIHRDVVPFGPMFLEKKLSKRGNKIILDLDDAVFVDETSEISRGNGLLYKLKYGKRFDTTIRLADHILCGNSFLEKHCNLYNNKTTIFPTLIDTNKIKAKEEYINDIDKLQIVWIGNPGNTSYIYTVLDGLNKVITNHNIANCTLLLIGASYEIEKESSNYNFNIVVKDWNIATEYDEIRSSDFGIMPLFDTDWSRGKCALKALQYYAGGIPVLASNVGTNKDVVVSEKNGFLVDGDDWEKGFESMINNYDRFEEMGRFARKYLEEEYSINANIDTLKNILREV